jgi:hypothetical protein
MTYRTSPPGFIAAVALLAIVASTSVKAAESGSGDHDDGSVTKTTQSEQDVVFNEHSVCTNDDVTGTAHAVFTEQTTTSGNKTRHRTTNSEKGKGTGAPSTAEYSFQDLSQQEQITTARTWTDVSERRMHLNRVAGPYPAGTTRKNDDMFLHQFVRTTMKDGTVKSSVDKTHVKCN